MLLRMFTMKRILLSLGAIAFIAAPLVPAGAQQSASTASAAGSASNSGSAAKAQTVTLPVTVRDKKGELVPNLQKSDLTLTQDGRPQTILSVARDTGQPVRLGLLIDTSRGMSGASDAEKKAAGTFVDTMIPAGEGKDQAFLIHFDREVELLEDFTSSREKLHTELEQMGPTQHRHDDSAGPETTGDDTTRESNRRGGDQLYDAIYLAADELMKNKDGRKVLVVFSNGADHGSKETMNDAVDAADRAGLTVYTIFFKGEKEESYGRDQFPGGGRRGGGYPGGGYPGGGGGYPGGGGGRRQPEPKSGAGVDGKKIMQEIATRTGGHAYEAKHTSDLEPIYKLISDELQAQYVLTYTPDKPDDEGGFHKISLTANNNKEWTVAAPEGYYAKGGQ